jgi:mRNA interferase RelE/StbE
LVYNITFKKSVENDLECISSEEAKRILDKIEEKLPIHAKNCKVLRGKWEGLRSYRVGDYRIIFYLHLEEILILRIGHRKDVYK